MAQVSFADLVNGTIPDASDFNARLNALKNRINNGVEADNIADSAVTVNKINNRAVTLLKQATGTLGGLVYYGTAGAPTELAGNTTATPKALIQTGTGTVSAAPVWGDPIPDGSVVQVVNYSTGAVATGTTTIPDDDTIPQNNEGTEFMTLAITPKATTNKLKIDIVFQYELNGASPLGVALFQDATAGALAAQYVDTDTNIAGIVNFTHYMTTGTTSATTFKIRAGAGSGTVTFNGNQGARKYGGVLASSITITEIKAS